MLVLVRLMRLVLLSVSLVVRSCIVRSVSLLGGRLRLWTLISITVVWLTRRCGTVA